MTENNQIRLGYLIHTNLPEYTEVFLSRSIGPPISRDIEFQRKFFTHTHTHTHTHTLLVSWRGCMIIVEYGLQEIQVKGKVCIQA